MSEATLALQRLARQVNGRARYAPAVYVRSVGRACRLIVNRADYRWVDELNPGAHSRVELYVGPNLVGIIYDAAGWEVA